jgi:hypothetical protein
MYQPFRQRSRQSDYPPPRLKLNDRGNGVRLNFVTYRGVSRASSSDSVFVASLSIRIARRRAFPCAMPHTDAVSHTQQRSRQRGCRGAVRRKVPASRAAKTGSRYRVGLPAAIADKVERYAETVDMSASKAISTLVGLGLGSHESRKREFFKRLRKNLAGNAAAGDVKNDEDQLVDEFRALILLFVEPCQRSNGSGYPRKSGRTCATAPKSGRFPKRTFSL